MSVLFSIASMPLDTGKIPGVGHNNVDNGDLHPSGLGSTATSSSNCRWHGSGICSSSFGQTVVVDFKPRTCAWILRLEILSTASL